MRQRQAGAKSHVKQGAPCDPCSTPTTCRSLPGPHPMEVFVSLVPLKRKGRGILLMQCGVNSIASEIHTPYPVQFKPHSRCRSPRPTPPTHPPIPTAGHPPIPNGARPPQYPLQPTCPGISSDHPAAPTSCTAITMGLPSLSLLLL